MKKMGLVLLLVALTPSAALAQANPFTVGNTVIGTHPDHGTPFSGFWRAGAPDYSLLTDGADTFINAPNFNGTLWFRGANNTWMALNASGLTNINQLMQLGPIFAYGASTFNNTTTFNGTTTFNPPAIFYGGFTAYASGNTFASSFSTAHASVSLAGNRYTALSANGRSFFYGDVQITATTSGAGNLSITNGTAVKPGGGVWGTYSDRRVKKDIADFELGLAEVERLHPVRFKYNGLGSTADDGKEYVGVIAQELEQVLPFMVSTKQEKLRKGDKAPTAIKQVDASAFTYMLVNAVQELAAQNKELQRVVCQDHPTDKLCSPSKRAALSEVTSKIARAAQ